LKKLGQKHILRFVEIKKFSQFLKDRFDQQRKLNPRLSLRGFAKQIELSPSSVSELFSGTAKWKLTPDRAGEIIQKLGFKKSEEKRALLKFGIDLDFVETEKKEIQPGNYDALTDWTVIPILVSHELGEKTPSVQEIARRMEVAPEKVQSVISDLINRGLLERDLDGRVRKAPQPLRTSDDVPNAKIRMFHIESLKLSERAIEKLPTLERDFNAITFAGNRKQLAALKEEIRALCEKATAIMNSEEENDEVYRLQVGLFPINFQGKQ